METREGVRYVTAHETVSSTEQKEQLSRFMTATVRVAHSCFSDFRAHVCHRDS